MLLIVGVIILVCRVLPSLNLFLILSSKEYLVVLHCYAHPGSTEIYQCLCGWGCWLFGLQGFKKTLHCSIHLHNLATKPAGLVCWECFFMSFGTSDSSGSAWAGEENYFANLDGQSHLREVQCRSCSRTPCYYWHLHLSSCEEVHTHKSITEKLFPRILFCFTDLLCVVE